MKKYFCLIFTCLFCQLTFGQLTTTPTKKHYSYFQKQLTQFPSSINFSKQIQQLNLQSSQKNHSNHSEKSHLPVPLAYAYKDLAFFCKIEVQLEKSVKLPVKFRLGSVDYVDYLEGKRTSY